MKSFCSTLCLCFYPRKKYNKDPFLENDNSNSTELQEKTQDSTFANNLNKTYLPDQMSHCSSSIQTASSSYDRLNTLESLFSLKYIRDDEIEKVNYTKQKIIEIINHEINSKNYDEYYKNDNLSISINTHGTFINRSLPIIKISFDINKRTLPRQISLAQIISLISSHKRAKWDKLLKRYRILHQEKNNTYIRHIWYKKFEFNISERDVIEKKVDFYNGSNTFYSFASSVNEEQYKRIKNVERLLTYFSGVKIYENQNSFTFKVLLQIDFKIGSILSFLNKTIPTKVNSWLECLIKEIK